MASLARPGRPGPTRTLRQPLTMNVVERSAPSTPAVLAESTPSDATLLRTALQKRVTIARRADKWMDKAMEEVLDVNDFQKALSYMHAAQYAEVVHERHLNSLCGYPLCANRPSAPYRAAKRFLVSTAQRTITEKEGNDEQAFCSKKCAGRSAFVAASLGTEAAWIRGKVDKLELLEDKEASGEVHWGGRRGDVLIWTKDEVDETAQAHNTSPARPQPRSQAPLAAPPPAAMPASATNPEPPATPAPATIPAPLPLPPLPTGRGMADLIAGLSIVERETPATKPLPPSTKGFVEQGAVVGANSLPLPLPRGGVLSNSSSNAGSDTSAAALIAGVSRRSGNSLLSNPKLAKTILTASKSINVEESESESEEEWEKSMGWGSGEEVNALFEEARRARELIE